MEIWFEQYADAVYKYILMIVKEHQLAEDLTQDTFIKAFTNANQFQEQSEVKTWLFRIAYTTTMNYFRKKHPIVMLFGAPIATKSLEDIVIEQEELRQLFKAISALKTSYQQVIVLRKVQQFTVKETAAVLGWSEGKVKMQLMRALKSLHQQMEEQGGMQDENYI
ncbi:RNA polymerase sigma factor [Bacillus niameyensis]|uniref:RNA polymerase sigma factor n=1 Tax=Bacillus niameyensis TaxID=1522308 RepID=UPI001E534D1F|nr:RNA polymerase sigma factor [Bacillus niameyensis]